MITLRKISGNCYLEAEASKETIKRFSKIPETARVFAYLKEDEVLDFTEIHTHMQTDEYNTCFRSMLALLLCRNTAPDIDSMKVLDEALTRIMSDELYKLIKHSVLVHISVNTSYSNFIEDLYVDTILRDNTFFHYRTPEVFAAAVLTANNYAFTHMGVSAWRYENGVYKLCV